MTTKTEAASRVRTVLQGVKDQLSKPGGSQINEATTRAHFLNPLLNALGYDGMDDLEFEHYLPDGKTFLDYRLHVDGVPRVAVEAKAISVPITDKEAAQGVSYASVLGDEWVVLTNAKEWRLYHTFAQTALAGKLVIEIDLTAWETDSEFDGVFERLWLISKESFVAGDGPGSWLTGQKIDAVLRQALADPASAEVKYIRKQLESRGITVESDAITSWFKSQLSGSSIASPAPKAPLAKVLKPGHAPTAIAKKPSMEADLRPKCWIVPSGAQAGHSAAEQLQAWLSRGFWGFGQRTPGRKSIRPGDWACFYAASSHEVLAVARIAGEFDQPVLASEWPGPGPFHEGVFKVPLHDIHWLVTPRVLDATVRAQMDAFAGRSPDAGWAWLVQTARRLTPSDFERLTGWDPK